MSWHQNGCLVKGKHFQVWGHRVGLLKMGCERAEYFNLHLSCSLRTFRFLPSVISLVWSLDQDTWGVSLNITSHFFLLSLSSGKSLYSVYLNPPSYQPTLHSSLTPCPHATLACSSLVAAIMGWEILRGMGRGADGCGGADWVFRSSSGIHPSLR